MSVQIYDDVLNGPSPIATKHYVDNSGVAGPKGDKGDKGDTGAKGADSTVVVAKASPADLTAAPTKDDFNGLLAVLKSTGLLT